MRANALLIFKLPAQFIAQQRNLNDLGGPIRLAETIGSMTLNAPYLLDFYCGPDFPAIGHIELAAYPCSRWGAFIALCGRSGVWRRRPASGYGGWVVSVRLCRFDWFYGNGNIQ